MFPEAYRAACDATDDYLRLTDGQLIEWMRPSVTKDLQNRTIRVGVKKVRCCYSLLAGIT